MNEEWCLGCRLCEYNCAFADSGLFDIAALKGKSIFSRISVDGDEIPLDTVDFDLLRENPAFLPFLAENRRNKFGKVV